MKLLFSIHNSEGNRKSDSLLKLNSHKLSKFEFKKGEKTMPNQLKFAVQELRRLRTIAAQGEVDDAYYLQKVMRLHEEDICRYRSSDKFTVYVVKGLHEFDTHYESLEMLAWALHDSDAGELLDDGIAITIELKRMTGRELGRLEAYEE
jgi:hypothetical protein